MVFGHYVVVFGIKETPTVHVLGAVVNALISLALGIYGWGPFGRHPASNKLAE